MENSPLKQTKGKVFRLFTGAQAHTDTHTRVYEQQNRDRKPMENKALLP
jgi:hypothetical protein